MQETPAENTAPAPAKSRLRPPWRPGESGNPKGRPRKGTAKLSRVFSRRSLMALRELGIDLPGKVRVDENVIRECCRALAPEMIERLRWIASQGDRPDFVGAARAAAADLLKYAGADVLQIEHSGTVEVQHQHTATASFLDAVLGRTPAIEGEVIHSPGSVLHNARSAQLPDMSTGYPQDSALPGTDMRSAEPGPGMPASIEQGKGREE